MKVKQRLIIRNHVWNCIISKSYKLQHLVLYINSKQLRLSYSFEDCVSIIISFFISSPSNEFPPNNTRRYTTNGFNDLCIQYGLHRLALDAMYALLGIKNQTSLNYTKLNLSKSDCTAIKNNFNSIDN